MKVCVLQCGLVLLGLALVLCSSGASSQPDLDLDLDVDLRHRRLLQRARALGIAAQEWKKREMEDLLSQLTLPESEFQESEISTLGSKQDVRVEMDRSAENPNSLPPRERKAGCKNFYWKGFTSC
ncbi:somatostatin-2-like [Astyanax mexicanus]|uniref:Somatostatin-2 n=2 Tax=Astyanax mexicanus TaxID=7994 RepID=A0A8B9KRB7_ASTMX|nr:somatostatin-2-like [Astyanax mexicanus]